MSATAQYATIPNVGTASITLGDMSRTGTPAQASTIFTAGANNSRIDRIVVLAGGSTTGGVLRLWEFDGVNYHPWQEIMISAAVPVPGAMLAFSGGISSYTNPSLLPYTMKVGYSLRASIDTTQITQVQQADSIVANGTLTGPIALGNAKFTTMVASAAAVAALTTLAGAGAMPLASSPVVPAVPSTVTLTSTGNIAGVNFFLIGQDGSGATITETLVGPNNGTVYSVNSYSSISAILTSAAVATATSAGWNSAVSLPVAPSKITISSAVNASAINFTIRGQNANGVTVTEVLAGPVSGGTVTSVNTYRAISYIGSSGSAAATSIGTPAIVTAINVTAQGGDF